MQPISPGAFYARDEEFRQSVIRKALLFGFSAEEQPYDADGVEQQWVFRMFNERSGMMHVYTGYRSLYSAAYDYLRLMKVPPEIIGDYRG